ncbi:MAG: phytoene desaturase family protein [Pseudomonadota bacterium]
MGIQTDIQPSLSDTIDGPSAVVIGAGFGGLAAAVRLAGKGYRVTLVEKLDGPGGRAYTYNRDGFVFDAGPTLLTAPHIFEDVWQAGGGTLSDDIDLRPCDPFYKIRFDDGDTITYKDDHEHMRAEIARISPSDLDGYERYLEMSEQIYDVAFEKLGTQPFHSLAFTMANMVDLIKLGGFWSVHQKVSQYFKHPKLQIAFSFHPLFIGGNPFSTTAFYCLIAHLERTFGVHYAVGGTGALVQGLVNLLERNGGQIRYSSPVKSIITNDGRASGVELESGERLSADIVVSNVDPAWTYGKFLSGHKRKRWTDRKIASADYSMSLFVWYFGTDRTYDDVEHHSIVLGPRYKGLLTDIFSKKIVTDDFSMYLHRPTAHDKSLAPEGCDTFYVLSPVPNLDSGTDWDAFSEEYRLSVQKRLEETVLPDLSNHVVSSHVLTPQDFQDRYSSLKGAAFAMEPKLFQSAYFRPHNRSEELDGLYMVGAGTHPGAGVPSVLLSAKIVADMIPDASSTATPALARGLASV